jgi:hypothetical protein
VREQDHIRRAKERARQWMAVGKSAAGAVDATRNGAARHQSTPAPTPKRLRRIIEPYRPFPVDALPIPIATYVSQAATALGCDPAFVALPVLAVAASAIGNSRTISLKRTWQEPAILWTAIIGD